MGNRKENNRNESISVSKAIAILCVIVAHTTFNNFPEILSALFARIGSMGVPVFMIISGYLFHVKEDIGGFIKKKFRTIIIPWWFCGIVMYIYTYLRMGDDINIAGLLKFVLGKGSYLYYMTVLMCCYIIFYYPMKKKFNAVFIVAILMSVISHQLTAIGIMDVIGNYLNIFNWIGFFSIGVIMQQYGIEHVQRIIHRHKIILIFVWGCLFVCGIFIDKDGYGYFSHLGMIMELISSFLIISLSERIHGKRIVYVGDISFSIYLIHMAIVPIIFKLLGNIMIINYIMPLITLIVCVVLIICADKITAKLKINKLYRLLIGMR